MKWLPRNVIGYLVAITLCVPVFVYAGTTSEAYRSLLLKLVELLTIQVELLTRELANHQIEYGELRTRDVSQNDVPSLSDLLVSRFYDGQYTAIFAVRGIDLVPVDASVLRSEYTDIWERFVALYGEQNTRNTIQELRLYRKEDAIYDAFTERDPNTGLWILGVNTYDVSLAQTLAKRELDRLLIHEIGHIYLDEHKSIFQTFVDRFWDTPDRAHAEEVLSFEPGIERDRIARAYYEAQPLDFVSEYAALSPLEDAVESFTEFVYETEYPTSTEMGAKVQFFEAYQVFRDARRIVSTSRE